MDTESTGEYDIVLSGALNRNTEAGCLRGVIIPNFPSETDRE